MSLITITIDTDNDAFGDTERDEIHEIDRILHGYFNNAWALGNDTLRDINGNIVGNITIDD